MVLPKVVALSVQLIIPVAGADRLPQLDVEPVCKGIAEQGGVTFRDPAVPQEKKNCIESELAVRWAPPGFRPTRPLAGKPHMVPGLSGEVLSDCVVQLALPFPRIGVGNALGAGESEAVGFQRLTKIAS
jgi:hypothetical protein